MQIKTTDKKVNDVYRSKDFTQFKFREDNREIIKPHVKSLAQKMKENGWIPGSQIKVNAKGEVIDGQHRYLAAKLANVPYEYIVESRAGFDEIQQLNQGQINWTKADHVHGHVAKGNQNYIILADFAKRYPQFRMTEHIMLLMNNFTSVRTNTFEEGHFKVADVKTAELWAENLLQLKPYFEKGYNKSIFVRAVIKLLARKPDEFIFSEFLHKVKLRPGMIYLCGSTELYIEMIEKLYNYMRKEKVSLRFLN